VESVEGVDPKRQLQKPNENYGEHPEPANVVLEDLVRRGDIKGQEEGGNCEVGV